MTVAFSLQLHCMNYEVLISTLSIELISQVYVMFGLRKLNIMPVLTSQIAEAMKWLCVCVLLNSNV